MAEVPYSFAVRARDISASGMDLNVVADEAARAKVAGILAIPAVNRLQAEVRLEPADRNAVRMRGVLKGEVVQTCIVTLDPVVQVIEENLDVTFLPAEEQRDDADKTVLLDALDEDDYELYEEGQIELADYFTEHLALGLDPYPRCPGTDFPAHIEDDASDRVSPFESLKQLKDNKS